MKNMSQESIDDIIKDCPITMNTHNTPRKIIKKTLITNLITYVEF